MNRIERAYRQEIAGWTGVERIARVAVLQAEILAILSLRIRRNEPELADRDVAKRVAESFYRTDQRALALLSKSA